MKAPLRVPTRTRTLLINSPLLYQATNHFRGETRNQRCAVSVTPTAARLGDDFGAVLFHLCRQSCRSTNLVARTPEQKIEHQWSEVDAFFRQTVTNPASIGACLLRGDHVSSLKAVQAFGKHVAGDAFAGVEKIAEIHVSSHHEVADDE